MLKVKKMLKLDYLLEIKLELDDFDSDNGSPDPSS